MCKNGFDTDDLELTLTRFTNKRRNIVFDESKLKRKENAPIALTGATGELGSSVLSGVMSSISSSQESNNEYKSPIRFSWEKKGFFRNKDGFN
ncbi:hypothetical protein [Lonsdalea populi]|uniref:hypothetical protein n=1 Tax=Lonsdalea populi TaxID=1172565 RepID=UPI000A1F8A0F|nr:hypothetical protein [Lonsdalea populi]QPQ24972.1 hypothetical protein I6N93_04000 [Lonsdalea populi]